MKSVRSHTIFFALAILGILILSVFAYLAQRSLTNGIDAKENIMTFYKYNRYLTFGTFLVYFTLLFVANLMYIKQRYWDTFIWAAIVFITFTIIDWMWLNAKIVEYRKANELWLNEYDIALFVGIMFAIFGLAIALGNYALLKRFFKEKNIPASPQIKEDNIQTNNH